METAPRMMMLFKLGLESFTTLLVKRKWSPEVVHVFGCCLLPFPEENIEDKAHSCKHNATHC